ncbi:MAG: hypothetical protein EXR71_10555 [Myxococcales bacterium]|nr:hypothetical protein [Myxococcales bacterium]
MRNPLLFPFAVLALSFSACNSSSDVQIDGEADDDHDRYFLSEDCDDDDATVNPGASEICDGLDNNCDGVVDEGVTINRYMDLDLDTYGDPDNAVSICAGQVEGAVENGLDCDDTDAASNPDGVEVCDQKDNDCDGKVDWGLGVPLSYDLIGDALGAARAGETVCVSAGTYQETFDFAGRNVAVVGVDGPEVTIIDGNGKGPVVSFDTDETDAALLSGFTITGGDDAVGAGIYIRSASPTLDNLIIAENECTPNDTYCYGTGIYAEDSAFTLTNSVVRGNVQYSTYAYYPYNYGAGIYLLRSEPEIMGVEIAENEVIPPNAAYYGGGYGIGMFVNGGAPWVEDVVIRGNVSDAEDAYQWYTLGGGLYLYGAGGGYVNLSVIDNEANGYAPQGGGIYLGDYTTATFQNLVVANNHIGSDTSYHAAGGGLFISYYYGKIENADVVGNSVQATYGWGGGLLLQYYAAPIVTNVSVAHNTAVSVSDAGGGGMAYGSSLPGTVTLTYGNFYDNGDNEFFNCTSPVGTAYTIGADPAYVDTSGASAATWDFALAGGSALIDAGDPDIEDADGSISDIGSRGGEGGADW